MEKIIEQGILYDFYGPLLTDHQKEIYEMMVYDNMSLGEIAEEKDISRQAVHDLIKRCDKQLKDYEERLQLIKRFSDNKDRLRVIKDELTNIEDVKYSKTLESINKSIDEILEEL